jgi:hypothetical protein
MVMEYTHHEYSNIIVTLGTCKSRVGSAAGHTPYVILVDFIQTLMSFDNWSNFPLEQEV